MSYPASTQNKDTALTAVNSTAIRLKLQSERAVSAMSSGDVSGSFVLGIIGVLREAIDTFNAAAAVPGIVAYARDQLENPTLDVTGEFIAMRNAAINARDFIVSVLPKDGAGFFAIKKLEADGTITERMFTPAQTAGLVTAITALSATID